MAGKPLTQAQFLARATAAHGGRYDYSQAVYTGRMQRLCIRCPEHGPFMQTPNAHLGTGKAGCPTCGAISRARHTAKRNTLRQHSLEDFLNKASLIHRGKYDYSEAVYTGWDNKIVIICPTHGRFEQTAGAHTGGNGCPACKKRAITATQAEFISKARTKHGERYDYSRVVYTNSYGRIIIGCAEHGDFTQLAYMHLYGQGCPECGKKQSRAKRRLGREGFIAKAQKVHGIGTYDYTQVVYTNNKSKVLIGCPAHGFFEQEAAAHVNVGNGCPRCGGYGRYETEIFRADCQVKFPSLDFSEASPNGDLFCKVLVKCPIHGPFQSLARDLLSLRFACPACAKEHVVQFHRLHWIKKATGHKGMLYFLRVASEVENFYKVGITYRPIEQRLKSLKLPKGYTIELLAKYQSDNVSAIYDWEQSILATFPHLSYKPKISFGGETECFSSCNEILEVFPVAG